MTPAPHYRLSVVVPAYHEADRIGQTVTAIRNELSDIDKGDDHDGARPESDVPGNGGLGTGAPGAGDPQSDGLGSGGPEMGLEIIVVDDGSGDRTADFALEAGANQVIVLPQNRGKGAAVRAGMIASRGATVAFTDADLAYHPAQLRRLLHEVEQGADAVIGNRRHPDSELVATSGVRTVGSRIVNRLASLVLLSAPHDTQCGLKGFSAEAARDIFSRTRIDGFAFDIEVLHLAERRNWELTQVPVEVADTGQRSTVHLVKDVLRLGVDLIRIRYWSWRGRYGEHAAN